MRTASVAALLVLVTLSGSGCLSRPQVVRGWAVSTADGGAVTRLAHGRAQSADVDVVIACNRRTGRASVLYNSQLRADEVRDLRTELMLSAGPRAANLPASVRWDEAIGAVVVEAELAWSPALVEPLVQHRLTVAALGTAVTMQARPTRAQVQALVTGCTSQIAAR